MSILDFDIIKPLGKGAFGIVQLVKRKADQNVYAWKRVCLSNMSDKDKQNSLNEICLLASINHPNVIGYKEAFYDEESNTINLVLEYADDSDLQTQINKRQSTMNTGSVNYYTEKEVWSLFIQMIKGLNELHKHKIIHRDLKSANIFLTKTGLCKLGDLNVSKIMKMGMWSTQTGTPYYASPEVWSDKPYNEKSDIWSVGCIWYEICALGLPFKGKNFNDVYWKIIKGTYPPIPEIYSKDLSTVVDYLLQVNVTKRPTCHEILNNPIVKKNINLYFDDILCNEDEHQGVDDNFHLLSTIKLMDDKEIHKVIPKYNKYNNKNNNKNNPTISNTHFKAGSELLKKIETRAKNNNSSWYRNLFSNHIRTIANSPSWKQIRTNENEVISALDKEYIPSKIRKRKMLKNYSLLNGTSELSPWQIQNTNSSKDTSKRNKIPTLNRNLTNHAWVPINNTTIEDRTIALKKQNIALPTNIRSSTPKIRNNICINRKIKPINTHWFSKENTQNSTQTDIIQTSATPNKKMILQTATESSGSKMSIPTASTMNKSNTYNKYKEIKRELCYYPKPPLTSNLTAKKLSNNDNNSVHNKSISKREEVIDPSKRWWINPIKIIENEKLRRINQKQMQINLNKGVKIIKCLNIAKGE